MILKLTPDNLVELPAELIAALGRPSHFDVALEGERLVLTPADPPTTEQVFESLESLGLTEDDVREAVAWARRTAPHST